MKKNVLETTPEILGKVRDLAKKTGRTQKQITTALMGNNIDRLEAGMIEIGDPNTVTEKEED